MKALYQCQDCKWLDLYDKHPVGYPCKNPNISHKGLGYLKQKSTKACKKGFEKK